MQNLTTFKNTSLLNSHLISQKNILGIMKKLIEWKVMYEFLLVIKLVTLAAFPTFLIA